MDHAYAAAENLAERYFLGELTDDEAEAFEAHYFDECKVCAEYVREELTMLETGRAVALEEKRRTPMAPVVDLAEHRARRAWVPAAAAAAVLAIAIGAPFLMRDGGPRVEKGQLISLSMSAERSTAPQVETLRAGEPATILVEIPAADFPSFDVSIRDASKRLVDERVRVSLEESANPVPLLPRALPAGSYEVVVEGVREGGSRTEIAVSPFNVQ